MSDSEPTQGAYDPTSLEGVPEAGRARLQQNRAGLSSRRPASSRSAWS